MKRPSTPGSPLNAGRYRRWRTHFGAYRVAVDDIAINNWLDQFDPSDRDLAARVLDVVEFYGQAQIHAAFRQALGALDGWHLHPSKRRGKWRFAALSGSAGESGDGMLYSFRLANQLDRRSDNQLFVSRSDLLKEGLGENDTVVLVDDFSGTGKQVCDAWNDPALAYGELLADVGRVYLVVVAASTSARDRILRETSLRMLAANELREGDNIFAEECTHFTAAERARLLAYCRRANRRTPKGYGDCGLVVVLQHRTPNNSIPILHAVHDRWSGLFPRND